jgi:predicted DNA-binding ribbon-helix-helix protein
MEKRSFSIRGHRTSIALEAPFWDTLEAYARMADVSLPTLIADIDARRLSETPPPGLASALRVWALRHASLGRKM